MQTATSASRPGAVAVSPTTTRLLSLDFFRGLTVAAMILVNNAGDWGHIYAPLKHAPWHGWTPTDLIFPFFLFIVGVSITYALGANKANGLQGRGNVVGKIVKRSLVLFSLGLFLNFFPSFNILTVRIPGVLQRIALVYLACSLLFLNTTPRQQLYVLLGLLAGYWLLLTVVPVPGVGYANLEPETNLSAWLDRTLLTPAHVYKPAKVWDPEGILSTLPAIGTGLIGVLTGTYLRRHDVALSNKIAWLFTAGVLTTGAGLAWNGVFPINKPLWTSSYVLLAGGLAMIGLALCYWLLDRPGTADVGTAVPGTSVPGGANPLRTSWFVRVFVAFGVNAITVFFLSGLIPRMLNLIKLPTADGETLGAREWLYQTLLVPLFSNPYNASLAGALTFVLIWAVILHWMYRNNIIIKV